jgi:hypothetical protein
LGEVPFVGIDRRTATNDGGLRYELPLG